MRKTCLFLLLAFVSAHAFIQTPGNVGYVVDTGTGKVWVIDLGRRLMDSAISAGAGASEMLVLPNNRNAFVSNYDEGTVSVIDTLDNRLRTTIALNQGPGTSSLAATPDGLQVYVTNLENSTVTVIDAMHFSVVTTLDTGNTPVQVNMRPDGRFAYVVNQIDNTVTVIDVHRQKVVNTLAVGSQPNQFAILPSGNAAYVVNRGSGTLTRVDLASNQVVGGPIPVGTNPVSVAFSTDGTKVYVVNNGSSNISVVNIATNQQTATIPVGTQPVAMVVNFDTTIGYVTNQGSNTVTALDLTDNSAYRQISVGREPTSLALDPNEDYLYVTNSGAGSGTVSVIDVNTDSVVGSIVGPAGQTAPVQFTFLNAPTLLEVSPNPAPRAGTIVLAGEGFLLQSRIRVSPPNGSSFTLGPNMLNSQVLTLELPSYSDAQATVEVINADQSSSERIVVRTGTVTPSVNPGGVVEAAGFARDPSPISGNALVAIFGNFPGMTRADAPAYQFPLPQSLGNVKVTFNGVPAPLLATLPLAGYHQINAVAPLNVLWQDFARVAVTIGNETSVPVLIHVAPTSPGIFYDFADGSVRGLHGDYSLISNSNPAQRGEVVSIYVTGLGLTNPPPIEGGAAPSDALARTHLPVRVVVGGIDSPEVTFSGLTPGLSGLYQVNFRVPPNLPAVGTLEVKIVAGALTSNVVKMAVR